VLKKVEQPTLQNIVPQDLPALALRSLTKKFGDRVVAVSDVNLTVAPGEILSILGPSGCGKTTLMRMIAGLEQSSSGEIKIFGRNVFGVPPHKRGIGLVFQSLAIFPHMSVRDNVSFGLKMQKIERGETKRRVDQILDLVHLPPADYASRMPRQLSGGQLQRVALARTLVTEPALVLFDEPMAALDRRLRDYMATELRAIQKKLGIAAIYVTHDQETASAMSDRIAIMQDGHIMQTGTPVEIFESPRNRFVAEFMGDVNLIRPDSLQDSDTGTVAATVSSQVIGAIDLTDGNHTGSLLLLRPEHLTVSRKRGDGAILQGRVIEEAFVSGTFRLMVDIGAEKQLIVHGLMPTKLTTGELVFISVAKGQAKLINA